MTKLGSHPSSARRARSLVRSRVSSALVALPLLASLLAARDARACGGCLHPEDQPPEQASVVLMHRMALSISPDVSVLWDQVQYTGSPSEFAWVLPVKPGARVEVASDAWFEALEAATAVRVTPPTIQCVTRSFDEGSYGYSGCGPGLAAGCGASEAGMEGREVTEISEIAPPEEPVSVVHKESAGPYEAVTLHSDVPGALTTWLTENGYAIDPTIQPIIDDYAANGFDFIALRLLPDAGVQQMKPVRVIQPGAVTTLPLRMVAAGTGATVGMTLFVITEGRYRASNFSEAFLPSADSVTWDFFSQLSSFSILRQQALANAGGAAWLTSYAQPGALFSPATNPATGTPVQYVTGLGAAPTIADAFMDQAFANGETELTCAGIFDQIALSGDRVVDPCPPDGGPCAEIGPNELDSRYFACGPLQDLAVALVGLHPRDVWITRLEAELPREALANDLELAPATQQPVSNLLVAGSFTNPPCEVDTSFAAAPPAAGSSSRRNGGRIGFLGAAALLLVAAIARRLARPAAAPATAAR